MITDIKELTEQIEEINGRYSKKMDEMKMLPERKEEFFAMVKTAFQSRLDTIKEVEPIVLYDFMIRQNFYEVTKLYRNHVNKHNKKVIRNRGNVLWDSKKGTYRGER